MNYSAKGQTLLELLVALGLSAVIVTSITVATVSSLKNAQYIKSQNLGTKYAQEGVELVRNIRDSNYVAFKNYNGLYCLGKNQQTLGTTVSSCSTPNVDSYVRSVQIEQAPGCGANVAKVTVTVSWNDGKCANSSTYCNSVPNITCLSTVNPVQTP